VLGETLVDDQERGAREREGVLELAVPIGRAEQHGARTRLADGEERDDPLAPIRRVEADPGSGRHPPRLQCAGQRVRPSIELAEGDAARAVEQGVRFAVEIRGALEELVEEKARIVDGGAMQHRAILVGTLPDFYIDVNLETKSRLIRPSRGDLP
jgi:hypothetical protein